MTEVEQTRGDAFPHTSSSHISPDHHHHHRNAAMTSSPQRDHHRHKRHTVHNPHGAHTSPHRRHHSPHKDSPKRTLPPGWEVVKSEGGVYYWHKSTGKTTWKFPSGEAHEHKKKQQSHTYINIGPGRRPHVVTQDTSHVLSTTTTVDRESSIVNGSTKMMNTDSHSNESGTANIRGNSIEAVLDVSESVGERFEERGEEGYASVDPLEQLVARETNCISRHSDIEEMNGVCSSPGWIDDQTNNMTDSDTQMSGIRRRPLVVHNYENFPFNPNSRSSVKKLSVDSLPDSSVLIPGPSGEEDDEEGMTSMSSPPPRSRTGSDLSNVSSTPPLPEHRYSESEASPAPGATMLDRTILSPSPSPAQSEGNTNNHHRYEGEQRDNLSPLHHHSQTQSRSSQVQREISELGNEYAIVNPAWKKNIKGRSPSLTRIDDSPTSLERYENETPPPLPDRPAHLEHSSSRQTGTGTFVDVDSDHMKHKREQPDIGQSVQYTEVSPQISPDGSQTQTRREMGVAYDTIDFAKQKGDENTYATIAECKPGDQQQPLQQRSGVRRRNERWLKTQSAIVPSSHVVSSTQPPSPPTHHPHLTTPTRVQPRLTSDHLTPQDQEDVDGAIPSLPPKQGRDFGAEETKGNDRRLHAMNVTIRRPSESEAGKSNNHGLKLSKEALLLRSGVTLRPGACLPRSSFEGEKEGRGDETEPSGSDEEDGLEPVTRAIKSLESRMITQSPPRQKDDQQEGEEEEGEEEMRGEDANLMLIPDGPPNWMQYQKRSHRYEDIKILDDPLDGEYNSMSMMIQSPNSARSVGNLNMAWDESDIRSQPKAIKEPSGGGSLVSASQPCLIDTDVAFPHLVKPSRVSTEAYKLRKLRLLQHKYEDIDIPEWNEVGGVPSSVGDVPSSPAVSCWLEADKDSAVTESGTMLPKGWQRMEDEQKKPYYWHIPTGRTQYIKPTGENLERLSLSMEESGHPLSDQSDHSTVSSSTVPNIAAHSQSEVKGHKFSARYLGNHPVDESELVPGECVKVVHNSIRKTNSAGKVKGKTILLVIRGMELQWVEPEANSPTTIQPINRIRVWGIGLENDREFGYVARDQLTKKHKCHVFRCDMPARAVAKALLENHQKMSTKSLSSVPMTTTENGHTPPEQRRAASPDMPSRNERTQTVTGSRTVSPPSMNGDNVVTTSCVYIGSCEVPESQGIDILNTAVDKLCHNKSRWVNINISIATSNIEITDTKSNRCIGEHRVRFLCFLGIAKDDRFCGYILETVRSRRQTEKKFLFHGFKMEPNTDKLCLALHTACQARYQRVLDSNPDVKRAVSKAQADRLRSKSTSSILGRLGSFKKNKKDDDSKFFTVQYLGCQQVYKSEGLEVVKGPIQQLSIPKSAVSSSPINLVEFEVSPAGLGMTDPLRRKFSRKTFSVKHITYVVRIRNYFAFVVRDGARYQCYVFMENSVPAATIVTTIQRMLAPESSKKR